MKNLYIECSNGISEASLAAALFEASGAGEEFLEKLSGLVFENIEVSAEKQKHQGISMTRLGVFVKEKQEENLEDMFPQDGLYAFEVGYAEYVKQIELQNAAKASGRGGYGARNLTIGDRPDPDEEPQKIQAAAVYDTPGKIFQIVNAMDVSEKIRTEVKEIYDTVASARAELEDVHYSAVKFDEEGELKAIVYTVAVAMLLEMINPEKIIASEMNIGSGSIDVDGDGILIPAPVTAHVLRNTPTFSNTVGENMTSTMAAAIMKHYAEDFSNERVMNYSDVGYGLLDNEKGTRYTRVFLGEIE